jgi:hypothetical protein
LLRRRLAKLPLPKLSTDEGIVGWSEFDEGFGSPGVRTVIERLATRALPR